MTCPRCRGTGFYYDRGFPARCGECEEMGSDQTRPGGPSLDQWEQQIRESADRFKVVRKTGPGRFERWEFKTEEEARRFAQETFGGDKRSMIYGVTAEGRSVMLGNL